MGRTACTEPQCLYKGALYLYLKCSWNNRGHEMSGRIYAAAVITVLPVQRWVQSVIWMENLHVLSACNRNVACLTNFCYARRTNVKVGQIWRVQERPSVSGESAETISTQYLELQDIRGSIHKWTRDCDDHCSRDVKKKACVLLATSFSSARLHGVDTIRFPTYQT